MKDILNLVINTPYNRAVLGLFGLSTLVRFLAVPAALRDPSGGLVHYQFKGNSDGQALPLAGLASIGYFMGGSTKRQRDRALCP